MTTFFFLQSLQCQGRRHWTEASSISVSLSLFLCHHFQGVGTRKFVSCFSGAHWTFKKRTQVFNVPEHVGHDRERIAAFGNLQITYNVITRTQDVQVPLNLTWPPSCFSWPQTERVKTCLGLRSGRRRPNLEGHSLRCLAPSAGS